MEAKIQAIHFDVSDKLVNFINKKIDRLARRFDVISDAEVSLRVLKPETGNNKEVGIKFVVPSTSDLYASKIADTFEEATDEALEALERQLEKLKTKNTSQPARHDSDAVY